MKVPASASNNRFALTCNDISVHDSAKAVCHHDGRPVAGSHQSIQSLQHSRELLKPCQPEVQQELLTALLACSDTEAWVHFRSPASLQQDRGMGAYGRRQAAALQKQLGSSRLLRRYATG